MTKTGFGFGILVIVICLLFVIWNMEFLITAYNDISNISGSWIFLIYLHPRDI